MIIGNVVRCVSAQRMAKRISQVASIGALPGGAVNRLSFTAEDAAARAVFTEWLEEAGLNVRVDGAGNIIGRADGTDGKAPVIILGSHLDSQPLAGRFDGVAGVVAAVEVIEVIHEAGFRNSAPIEVVAFSGEEAGARFDLSMIGSRAIVGRISDSDLQIRCRLTGVTLREAMESIGVDVEHLSQAERPPGSIKAVLELHIEQGPYLERWGLPVGVVTDVAGAIRLTCQLYGQQSHTGGTPMGERRDPLAGAAEAVLAIERAAKECRHASVVASVTYLTSTPQAITVIPRSVRFIVDIRGPNEVVLDEVKDQIMQAVQNIALARNLTVEWGPTWGTSITRLDAEVIRVLTRSCEELDIAYAQMTSGGGHDAMMLGHRFPAGVIFVPSANGISHSPEESTELEDLVIGTRVLTHAACSLST